MDIDLLKSTPDDHQIDMMLMMHMDKPTSDIIGGGHYVDSQMMSFSCGGNIPQYFDTRHGNMASNSPIVLTHHNSNNTISFSHDGSNNNSNSNNNNVSSPNSHIPYNGGGFHSSSSSPTTTTTSQKHTSMAAMREMIFRIAAMQPIYIDPEAVKPPKRRNVKISKDPQSVAARHRRERISERIRILQRLVPGGTKMDTASMLDEAIHYVKFLKTQVQSLERTAINNNNNRPLPVSSTGLGFPVAVSAGGSYFPVTASKANYHPHHAHTHAPPQFSDA